MRIALNLATRPFADLGPAIKRLRITMGVLVVVAIGLGLGLRASHQKADEARARDHSLDGQIGAVTHERESYENMMRQPPNARLLTQVGVLNQLFDEKAFSWTLAMEDLETVLPGGVQVSTIEPVRAKDGHITLHLRVTGPRDRAVDLVRNLEHSRRFLLPRIVGENAEANEAAGQRLEQVSASNRIELDLLAEYNPLTSGERKPARAPQRAQAGANRNGHAKPTPAKDRTLPGLGRAPGRQPYTGPAQPGDSAPQPKPSPSATPGGPQ